MPLELLRRLDTYAEQLRAEQPGLNIRRVDVVRVLLIRALDDIDKSSPKKA